MNASKLIVGYVGLSKASWKTPKIEGLMTEAAKSIASMDVKLVGGDSLTTTEDEALELASKFRRAEVDAVVMHFVTFPTGSMIPVHAQSIDVPIIIFANPEEAAPGGLWEQNSFCGANMAAYVMRRLGKATRFAWGPAKEAAKAVELQLRMAACEKNLDKAKIGLVGGRVPGFYTSGMDEMNLRAAFGTAVEVIELLEVIECAKSLGKKESEEGLARIKRSAKSVCGATEKELSLAGDLLMAFLKTAAKYKLTALAIRCWPELPDFFGIAPCAVIGALNDAGLATSCEGDVPGAVSMLIQKSISGGGTPIFMDFISFDEKDNTGVVWHCGASPSSLCRDFEETVLRKHMRVDGGDKKGLTNDFSLKAGRVTISKIDESKDGYRMLIFTGTALDTDKFIRGNPLRIKFDAPVASIVKTIMKKGFEHHYSVIHADIKDDLIEFCELNKIEAVTPN